MRNVIASIGMMNFSENAVDLISHCKHLRISILYDLNHMLHYWLSRCELKFFLRSSASKICKDLLYISASLIYDVSNIFTTIDSDNRCLQSMQLGTRVSDQKARLMLSNFIKTQPQVAELRPKFDLEQDVVKHLANKLTNISLPNPKIIKTLALPSLRKLELLNVKMARDLDLVIQFPIIEKVALWAVSVNKLTDKESSHELIKQLAQHPKITDIIIKFVNMI